MHVSSPTAWFLDHMPSRVRVESRSWPLASGLNIVICGPNQAVSVGSLAISAAQEWEVSQEWEDCVLRPVFKIIPGQELAVRKPSV
jgi:hypothetical protein